MRAREVAVNNDLLHMFLRIYHIRNVRLSVESGVFEWNRSATSAELGFVWLRLVDVCGRLSKR